VSTVEPFRAESRNSIFVAHLPVLWVSQETVQGSGDLGLAGNDVSTGENDLLLGLTSRLEHGVEETQTLLDELQRMGECFSATEGR
jgi:hypothetical protein